MTKTKGPRTFEHYPSTLILFLEEEIGGIALFTELSHYFEGRQKRALELMAECEVVTVELLRTLLDKHGLKTADPVLLTQSGIKEAKAIASAGWEGLLARWRASFPDFILEFERIEALAPPEDLATLKAVTAHEVAAIDFLQLELEGADDSQKPLEVFLQTYAVGGPGRSALNSK